uniref:cGMP-dependent protein kinase n=1 Tax=Parascaris univalens TaxID=6257 RepID=A0A915BHU3_PARUN
MIFTLAAVLLSKCIVLLLEHFFCIYRILTLVGGYAGREYRRLSSAYELGEYTAWWTPSGTFFAHSANTFVVRKMPVDSSCGALQEIADDKPQQSDNLDEIQLNELQMIETIGLGGFGRVQLVRCRRDQRVFALKVMNKKHIVQAKQQQHVNAERDILLSCRCPFIVTLHRTYRDAQRVYMLMEYCIGGEIWTLIRERGRLDEPMARYYCAAALEALDYLHRRSIVYRDLKPENMLLQKDGIPKLVDFGFAKRLNSDGGQTWTFCGTAEYIAPEVVLNKGHSFSVDIWALGIFLYELLTGSPPFVNTDPMVTYNAILRGVGSLIWPKYLSDDAVNLIFNFCRREPHQRLGYGRMESIREDPWFNLFDFDAFRSLKMRPPFIPTVCSDSDTRNFDNYPVLDRFATGVDETGWDSEF